MEKLERTVLPKIISRFFSFWQSSLFTIEDANDKHMFSHRFCQGKNHMVQSRPMRPEEKTSGDLKERYTFLRKMEQPK